MIIKLIFCSIGSKLAANLGLQSYITKVKYTVPNIVFCNTFCNANFSTLTIHILEHLLNHIKNFHPISIEAQQALQDCFEQVELHKNDLLLSEGQQCRHLYFLEKGALRGFYNADGKEITHWFGFENDFVTSFHSFITREPAVENIQLLENCTLWSISKETLTGLLNQFHEIERLVRIINEKYYIRLEERFVNAQFKTAAERYENLLTESPHILERVPLGYIASYLGISQETLSRIRSKF
jgi:CRP-like cAMP-binding protein